MFAFKKSVVADNDGFYVDDQPTPTIDGNGNAADAPGASAGEDGYLDWKDVFGGR